MSVDKLVDSTALDAGLTSIANAIRRKSGGSKQLSFPDGFVDEIGDIAATYDKTPIDDVTFVDYDGTVLYTYSADEFLALTEMPANPSHTGLVAQGWNWTLAGAKEYVGENGCLCIGQNYTTDDGCTRFYVTIPADMTDCPMYVVMYTSIKGGVTIDWGDGETTITDGNANNYKVYSHYYSNGGDYMIELDCTDGTFSLGYNGANLGLFYTNTNLSQMSRMFVHKVEIGDNCDTVYRQAFAGCANLKTISIPTSLLYYSSAITNSYLFDTCSCLKCVVFPQGADIKGSQDFNHCYNIGFISYGENVTLPTSLTQFYISNGYNFLTNLKMITLPPVTILSSLGYNYKNIERMAIPGTYTTLSGRTVDECYKLRKIIIPESVTTIADYAMMSTPLKELHMRPTTPPTISNTRGMPNMATFNGVIYVPYSADHSILEAYKTATNWSTYAQYIQEESQS